jgi:hypothetical protein
VCAIKFHWSKNYFSIMLKNPNGAEIMYKYVKTGSYVNTNKTTKVLHKYNICARWNFIEATIVFQ